MSFHASSILLVATFFCLFSVPCISTEQANSIEEIVVTAQRKSESIQVVPIAVSAFSVDDLSVRLIDDARDLQTLVPNMSYTGSTGISSAGGEGFQIRGVGNSVGGATGDVGVAIHHNNAPQIQSRIASSESYDMERVEILRGPQGTLYGRNATGGVVNYITAKPLLGEFDFSLSGEFGNYNAKKYRGMVNLPIGDKLALRVAGSSVDRDGYTKNQATGNDIDDRDIWSVRATLAFEPIERVKAWILYEKFEEHDAQHEGTRSLCISDPGPNQVGSTIVANAFAQNFLSQGCLPGSVYSSRAYGNPNSVGTFGGRFASLLAFSGAVVPPGDLFANQYQSKDLRVTSEYRDPATDIEQEIVEFEITTDITDELTLSLLGHSSEDSSYAVAGSYQGAIGFLNSPATPGGIWTDFQSGPASSMLTLNIFDYATDQNSLELRMQSAFNGAVNFNLGLLVLNAERNHHTLVSPNTTSLYLSAANTAYCAGAAGGPYAPGCVYFDPNPRPDYTGHQYFDTYTPYTLNSQGIFGELYANLTNNIKLTTGLRYTDDTKKRTNLEIQYLSPDGANGIGTGGYPTSDIRKDEVSFQEYTGRVVLDWMPQTQFSQSTLFYVSYSRGYKAGGFSSPEQNVNAKPYYEPEFVNSFELGTKNTFTKNHAQLNASLFYYDYKDYQISKIEQFSSRNENVDATVFGLEIESRFEVFDGFEIGTNLGWLKTEINSGESVDPLDRTVGNEDYAVLQSYQVGCIAPVAELENVISLINSATLPATILFNSCSPTSPLYTGGFISETNSGIAQNLSGNDLPNAPEFSANINILYHWNMAGWAASAAFDYGWKDASYASMFNGQSYELRAWSTANASLNLSSNEFGLGIQFFIKNIFDKDTIVNYRTGPDGTGLPRNVTLLDPRTYGLDLSYTF